MGSAGWGVKGVKFRVRGSVGIRFRVRGSVGNRFRVGVSVRNRFREKYCRFPTTSGQLSDSHSPLLREKPAIINYRQRKLGLVAMWALCPLTVRGMVTSRGALCIVFSTITTSE